MTEKEARKLIEENPTESTGAITNLDLSKPMIAKGYLEAIEKAKVLEEALDNMRRDGSFHGAHFIALEAMAKWEKIK